jgi:DNA (cytosine-5)-methyltransferase 1
MTVEQISIFDVLNNEETEAVISRKIKVLSLFSGIGAFEKALDNLSIPYELVGYCEIDKYASKSYSAIHGVPESMNLGDITKVDEKALPKDIDLCTYGFPCQDISLAGKQKGLFNDDGTQTRSGLFFEALRIIEETQPRVAIAENVKNLVGKKFNAQFQVVLASLEAAGYNNYYKVLNAKDFGVPQNRERVFIVSIRKDIDDGTFRFNEGFPLKIRLKDVLEDEVDEKYYLKNTKDFFIKNSFDMEARGNGFRFDPHVKDNADVAKTVTTRAGGRMDDNFVIDIESEQSTFKFDSTNPQVRQIANLMPSKTRENPNQGRLYDKEGLSPTLGAMQGGNRQPFVVVGDESVKVREATKQGYAEAVEGDSINLEQPNSKTRRGRVGKQVAQTLTTSPQQAVVEGEPMAYGYIRKDGCVGTIMTDGSSPKKNNRVLVWDGFNQRVRADQSCVGTLTQNCGADLKRNGQGIIEPDTTCLRIRKLTPKECYRLMGFDDEDFEKAEAVNSNTQLYKQAGNSIVVPVVVYIIKALLKCGAI